MTPDYSIAPYHLRKSDERSQPYQYQGRVPSPYGWRPHRLIVYVASPADAERLRHSVPHMRVDKVTPMKVAHVIHDESVFCPRNTR